MSYMWRKPEQHKQPERVVIAVRPQAVGNHGDNKDI